MKTRFTIHTGPTISVGMFLTIVLVTLEATEKIDIGWWLAFGPLWIPAAIAAVLIVLVVLIATLRAFFSPR